MNKPEQKRGGFSSLVILRERPLSMIAITGAAILLGLIVADGMRNRVPDDAPANIRAQPVGEADVSASFPVAPAQASSTEKVRECAGQTSGPAVIGPRPIGDQSRWLTSIDYPMASLKAGHEGVTAMALTVSRSGTIAGCAIAGSSGHSLLDAAACATLRLRGRYEPARDAAGCPVPAMIRQRVRWQIPTG